MTQGISIHVKKNTLHTGTACGYEQRGTEAAPSHPPTGPICKILQIGAKAGLDGVAGIPRRAFRKPMMMLCFQNNAEDDAVLSKEKDILICFQVCYFSTGI